MIMALADWPSGMGINKMPMGADPTCTAVHGYRRRGVLYIFGVSHARWELSRWEGARDNCEYPFLRFWRFFSLVFLFLGKDKRWMGLVVCGYVWHFRAEMNGMMGVFFGSRRGGIWEIDYRLIGDGDYIWSVGSSESKDQHCIFLRPRCCDVPLNEFPNNMESFM
jgi:hypothetical protein